MTSQLAWRVAVALMLAALAGLWLGALMMAIKHTGNTAGAVATAVFGVLFIAAGIVAWATDDAVIE